jgi:hypothetical protein
MAINKSSTNARIQQIRDAGKTPLEKAQTLVGKPLAQVSTPKPPPRPLPVVTDSLIRTPSKETPYIPPVKDGKPNQEYIRTIPPPPPKSPITESIIRTEIDKIIEESNKVIKQIENKVDPARPPVNTTQDTVKPPPALTPTEIALENRKDCTVKINFPNIVINNENIISVGQTQTQGTESGDIVNIFDPNVELRRGCTDVTADNYDPAALVDDGSCVYADPETGDPILTAPADPGLNIPSLTQFVDSHGGVIFEVPATLVLEQGKINLDSGATVDATLELSLELLSRTNATDSDLILTEEAIEITKRKAVRKELGELASDTKLPSEQAIVIIGNKESIKQEIIRNSNGLILLQSNDSPKLKVSLRSQSFTLRQYRRTIDTKFKQLLGRV